MMKGHKTMVQQSPRRPMAGGTRDGLRPERYDYWRVGYGSREEYALGFWLERAGEFHAKPNHVASHYVWTHTTQIHLHLSGEALFEYPGHSAGVSAGDVLIVPAHTPFTYRGRHGVKYHWLSIDGSWPSILGVEPHPRHMLLKPDDDLATKFTTIREVLILQRHGYPLKAVGIFYELVARLEEIGPGFKPTPSTYPEPVRNAIVFLIETYADPFNAGATAAAVNLSESHLRALFEKWLGESPKQFHTRCRIDQAKRLLNEQRLSVSEVALQVGFNDVRHFSRVFKKYTGQAPSHYQKGVGG